MKIRTALLIVAAILILWGLKVMNRKEFLAKLKAAMQSANLQGFDPQIVAALASYESGDGSGGMASPGNNIFSLQAPQSWKGPVTVQKSTGNKFKAYPNYTAAINDFISLLIGWPSNYGPAVAAARAGDINAFASALKNAPKPYDSTNKNYISELVKRYADIA